MQFLIAFFVAPIRRVIDLFGPWVPLPRDVPCAMHQLGRDLLLLFR